MSFIGGWDGITGAPPTAVASDPAASSFMTSDPGPSAIGQLIANVQVAAINDFVGSPSAPTPQPSQPQGSGAFAVQPESASAGVPSPTLNQGQTAAGVFKPNP